MTNDDELLRNMGAELRALRAKAGFTLEEVAGLFGRKRDNLSKIELGQRNMTLGDYLSLMHFYRGLAPDHPALALHEHLKTRKRRKA
jgi:transcriptional regulator with XRE-family HTH domain